MRRAKRFPLPDKTTVCRDCGETKSTKTGFYLRKNGRLTANRCRPCTLIRQKVQKAERRAKKRKTARRAGTQSTAVAAATRIAAAPPLVAETAQRAGPHSLLSRVNIERRDLISKKTRIEKQIRVLDTMVKGLREVELTS